MNYLLLMIAIFISCEIILRLPLIELFILFLKYLKRVKSTLVSKKISDHWKEITLPTYAFRIFKISNLLLFYLLLALSPFAVFGLIYFQGDQKLINFFSRIDVLFFTTGIAVGYISVRRKLFQ